jgi:hypothetical protein
MLDKKRYRNPSTNTRCSLDDERILDYDFFLREIDWEEESEINNKATKVKMNAPVIKKTQLVIKNKAEKTMHSADPKGTKKIRRKSNFKRTSNVYDIDNFIIQNNALRIHQRHEKLDIPVPVYREISINDFVTLNENLYLSEEVISFFLLFSF